MFGREQSKSRVRLERRMAVHFKRHQRIVLRTYDECRNSDCVQIPDCRLSRVVIRGRPETEKRSREAVVKFPNSSNLVENGSRVKIGSQSALSPHPIAQTTQKPACIKDIRTLIETPYTRGQINRCRDGANTSEQVGLSQFASQLESNISAQREADQEKRPAMPEPL